MSPGQTIKLTLLDFGSRSGRDENICHVYATIKEAAASTSETVCASRHRSTLVYTSSTNVVEVRLVSKRQDDEKSGFYFLIKYEAVGCADPKKPTHGLLERRGDVVTVGCIYGEERWVLKCDGHTWTGNRGNCTGGNGLGTDNNTMWGKINFPSGLSIILIMCIALFIGIVILTVGLLCLKRRHLGSNQAEQPTKVEHGPDVYNSYRRTSPRQHSMTSPGDPGGQPPSHNPQPHPQQHTFPRVGHLPKPPNSPFDNQPENDYSRTWQMQRHPGVGSTRNPLPLPPGTGYGVDPRGGAGYGGNNNHRNAANYDQHVYESPKFERHELNSGSDEGSYSEHVPGSAQYYELDPEAVPLDCGPAPVHSMRDVMGTALEEQRLVSRNPLTPHMGK